MKAREYTARARIAELRRQLGGDSIARHRQLDQLIKVVREDERDKTLEALRGAGDRADRETAAKS